jgi:phosphoribosylglycinamide formyltransferase 2
LYEAQDMAEKVTEALGGAGLLSRIFLDWWWRLFLGIIASTSWYRNGNLAGTQNFNEFELHLRAILSLPIFEITLEKRGASAVILASENSTINLFRNRKYCFIQNGFQNLWQTNFKTVKNGCGFSQWYFRNSIEEVVEKAKQPVWLPCTRNLFNRFLY